MNGFAHDNKARGVYVGAVGGLPLFSSDTKFDSGAFFRKKTLPCMLSGVEYTQLPACTTTLTVPDHRVHLMCMCAYSGTGWPSFYAPVDPEHVIEVRFAQKGTCKLASA